MAPATDRAFNSTSSASYIHTYIPLYKQSPFVQASLDCILEFALVRLCYDRSGQVMS